MCSGFSIIIVLAFNLSVVYFPPWTDIIIVCDRLFIINLQTPTWNDVTEPFPVLVILEIYISLTCLCDLAFDTILNIVFFILYTQHICNV